MQPENADLRRYRPEIDGLRTIAVVPVVLFHAGAPFVSGGFGGVDIFFVISGFLISGLLVDEFQRTGRISIADFYARRIRRLLPALMVVLLCTLALGVFLLPASGEQQELSWSAISALLFVSNFFFWRSRTGYFAESSDSLPLLHTWTLAVEEQFYIVWPLFLIVLLFVAAHRKGSTNSLLFWAILSVGFVSFTLSIWLTTARPSAAFFLAPARAWEFAIGALLALTTPSLRSIDPKFGGLMVMAGLIAIGAAIVWIDSPHLSQAGSKKFAGLIGERLHEALK